VRDGQPVAEGREYAPKEGDLFTAYLFMVIHAVTTAARTGSLPPANSISSWEEFSGDLSRCTPAECFLDEEQAIKSTVHIARAPDRVAYTLLDSIVDNYKPALDELSLEIAELEQQAFSIRPRRR